MPELPEVETTVRQLENFLKGRKIEGVWAEVKEKFGKSGGFSSFSKKIKGNKIIGVRRKGKNILIDLSGRKVVLAHLKMTGHFLLGKWKKTSSGWRPLTKGPLANKANGYIHFLIWLDNGKMLALSDLRKFAKIELWDKDSLEKSDLIAFLGPNPLDRGFDFENFKEIIKKKKGPVKKVLMDQSVISGIGNFYSDEILWRARISPFRETGNLKEEELKKLYENIKSVLKKAIEMKGESFSDFRTVSGEKGGFDKLRKVYKREGKKCFRCGGEISRVKIGGRSAHFCPNCQKF